MCCHCSSLGYQIADSNVSIVYNYYYYWVHFQDFTQTLVCRCVFFVSSYSLFELKDDLDKSVIKMNKCKWFGVE